MSLTWAPGRQQSFLCRRSSLRIGLSAPFSKESPITVTRHFFLVNEVLMLGEDWSDLGSTTNWGEPSSPPLSTCPCRTLYLFFRGSCEAGDSPERHACIAKQGPYATALHPPILHRCSWREERIVGSLQQEHCLHAGSPPSPVYKAAGVTYSMQSHVWLPRSRGQ